MVFKNLCVLVLWKKVASALEGLSHEGRKEGIVVVFASLSTAWVISQKKSICICDNASG